MDLLDLWRGRLSYRRLWVLIQHLPPESATHTAIRDSLTDDEITAAAEEVSEKYGRWSRTDQLIGQLIDVMATVQWTLVALKTPKGKNLPAQPEPFPRPGVKRRGSRRSELPTGKVLSYLEGIRAAHRRLIEGGDDDIRQG